MSTALHNQSHATRAFLGRLTDRVRSRVGRSDRVRVRIAPSPTGPLHIGTARTALLNYLFARHHNGEFILRIEDTDLERSDKAFERDIVEQLRWLGITWDEGIDEYGHSFGPEGPYRQTERTPFYTKAIEHLLNADRAYYCFCTKEQLEAERAMQRTKKEPQRYVGTCRVLLKEDSHRRVLGGERAIVRLRMPEEELVYRDIFRGEITFNLGLFGDITLSRTNPSSLSSEITYAPLYNFAVVVDDAEMHISHVLRGEDHISNTPKQIMIARALGYPEPTYGHFPLILGPDKAKISKRHGATSVAAFRELGYYPEALLNFLALLGFNPGTEEHGDLYTLEELVSFFDESKVQASGAIWDHKKLQWFNQQYSRRDLLLIREEEGRAALRASDADAVPAPLLTRAKAILLKKKWVMGDSELTELLVVLLERTPPEELEKTLTEDVDFFFTRPDVEATMLPWKDMSSDETQKSLMDAQILFEAISEEAWKHGEIESILMAAAASPSRGDGKVDRGRLLWPLRVALTGKKKSPGPVEVAVILGKKETRERLTVSINLLEHV